MVASDRVQVGSTRPNSVTARDEGDHDKGMQVLLHQIRLAVSRLNRPSGRNISTAAMMR